MINKRHKLELIVAVLQGDLNKAKSVKQEIIEARNKERPHVLTIVERHDDKGEANTGYMYRIYNRTLLFPEKWKNGMIIQQRLNEYSKQDITEEFLEGILADCIPEF